MGAAGGRRRAGGVGTAREPKHEMFRAESPFACQLTRVLLTTEQRLHHFSIPVATSGPDRREQLSTVCTFAHGKHRPPIRV